MGSVLWVMREGLRVILLILRVWLWWQARSGIRIVFVEVGVRGERFTLPESLTPRRGEMSRQTVMAILEICGGLRCFQYLPTIFLPGGSWETVAQGRSFELIIPCSTEELHELRKRFARIAVYQAIGENHPCA